MKDTLRRIRRMVKAVVGRDLFQRRQLDQPLEFHGTGTCRWAICPEGVGADSVVYACGVGRDITFEESLIARYGLTAHGFDPTPRSKEWVAGQSLPPTFEFHDYGVADFDGLAQFLPPSNPEFVSYTILPSDGHPGKPVDGRVYRLSTIMERLGHDRIDILKMDVEGAEYGVIRDMISSGVRVRQVLVEFHHRFPSVGLGRTKEAIRQLNQAGYRVFYVSPLGEEFSFIRDE